MTRADEPEPCRVEAPHFRLVVEREYKAHTDAIGLVSAIGFDSLIDRSPRISGGRGTHRILEAADESIRLRLNHRGGILSRWLGDRFLSSSRPFREFHITRELKRSGLSLATPVLAVGRRHGIFWRSAFASIDRPKARDGVAWLDGHRQPDALRAACRAFAESLRRFHDAGAWHRDLQLRNVLIEDQDDPAVDGRYRCVLIDLDRTRILPTLTPRQRMQDLMRLARSFEKLSRANLLTRRLRALTLSAYCARDRSLRRSMLRCVPREARRLRRHRFGWWLSG